MQRHITPQTPVLVLNTTTRREQGRKAQLANIKAAKVNFSSQWTHVDFSNLARLCP